MKSMVRLAPDGLFTETPPMRRIRLMPRARLHRTIWCAPGARHTNCRRSSPIAPTTTDPINFPEKLIPHMIIKGLADEELPVYGDGLNIRDWLYVEDHARALTTRA